MSEDKSIIEEAEDGLLSDDVLYAHREDAVAIVKEGMFTRLKKSLYSESKTKGALDAFQEKLVSRKLLVFLTATGLLIGAGLDPDTWGMIAMCYIGGQSAIDAVQTWRHGK